MNKIKITVVLIAFAASSSVVAGPRGCGGGGFRPGPCGPGRPGYCRPCPPPPHHGGHHGGFWGRGGCNFWPGFIGGVVGGVVANTIVEPVVTRPVVVSPTVVAAPTVVTTPTVVTAPVVTQTVVTQPATTIQNVWVEGCYVDQLQANGSTVRVWQPGHYEQRTVTVQ